MRGVGREGTSRFAGNIASTQVDVETSDRPASMPPASPLPALAVMPAVLPRLCTDRASYVTSVTFPRQRGCKSSATRNLFIQFDCSR